MNDKNWEELVRLPENYRDMPPQMLHDMLCAIRSLEAYNDQLYLDDFRYEFVGPISIWDLEKYDKGFFKWLELTPASTFDDLRKFRGYEWMCKASEWIKKGIPPVIAISYKNYQQIGDGRGRINFANMMGYDVPLYLMEYINENNN